MRTLAFGFRSGERRHAERCSVRQLATNFAFRQPSDTRQGRSEFVAADCRELAG